MKPTWRFGRTSAHRRGIQWSHIYATVLLASRDLWQSTWQEAAALEAAFTQTSQSRAVWTKHYHILPTETNWRFWQSPTPAWQCSESRFTYWWEGAHQYNGVFFPHERGENGCQNKLAK